MRTGYSYHVDPTGARYTATVSGRNAPRGRAFGRTIAELIEWASEYPRADLMIMEEVTPTFPYRKNCSVWSRDARGRWCREAQTL